MLKCFLLTVLAIGFVSSADAQKTFDVKKDGRTRVIVTSDGEIDDECSMVRFLLYTNEFDVEGIVTSSSQYPWHGHKWAGDDWLNPYLDAYEKVYSNLIQHDKNYPTPQHLRSVNFLGNVELEGETDKITPGSEPNLLFK